MSTASRTQTIHTTSRLAASHRDTARADRHAVFACHDDRHDREHAKNRRRRNLRQTVSNAQMCEQRSEHCHDQHRCADTREVRLVTRDSADQQASRRAARDRPQFSR